MTDLADIPVDEAAPPGTPRLGVKHSDEAYYVPSPLDVRLRPGVAPVPRVG